MKKVLTNGRSKDLNKLNGNKNNYSRATYNDLANYMFDQRTISTRRVHELSGNR